MATDISWESRLPSTWPIKARKSPTSATPPMSPSTASSPWSLSTTSACCSKSASSFTAAIGSTGLRPAGYPAGLNPVDPMAAVKLDALFEQHALVVERFHGEDAVLGDIGGVADVGDFLALIGHVLGERDSHEMSVAIENQHAPARHRLAGGDLEGRQHVGQGVVGAGNRAEIRAAAVAAPVRAGRDDDAVGAITKYLVGAHPADAELHFDVFLQLRELDLPVRD